MGLLAWVWAVPKYVRAHSMSSMDACINNLRLIDGAKQEWALEYGKTSNDVPTMDDLRVYMGRGSAGEIPHCPAGGTYIPGKIGEPPRCSIGGPSHSLDDDDSTETSYSDIVGSLAFTGSLGLISCLGLVVTFALPLKPRP